ncbi:MAG TPA: hypothetical protein VGR15_06415 [Bacteroidota bacterium]|jgi:hypothetical protein|nr:hypothetical protein [Bacteroidota bacterium]
MASVQKTEKYPEQLPVLILKFTVYLWLTYFFYQAAITFYFARGGCFAPPPCEVEDPRPQAERGPRGRSMQAIAAN